MQPMPLIVSWGDLALRLGLTLVAGALIGFNRDEHGRPAGLRTTMLVCLAASVATLQANLLLPTAGKPSDGFAVADILRLPLGILSGIGFIGAGAIVRRQNLVLGVTTAATLWVVTVIGLCFGGGQIALGIAATGIGFLVLWGLKLVEEKYIQQNRRARLILVIGTGGPSSAEIANTIRMSGYRIAGESVMYSGQARCCETSYDVRWRSHRSDVAPPEFLTNFASRSGVQKVQWRPMSMAS